ncbi:MAG TPA: PQQ-binding-like beta-propeller repeat protein [Gemmataceae bacterium]|nr:PQQ-binding-like beta-propeller repeat protein [Gemmataceae bacterium]
MFRNFMQIMLVLALASAAAISSWSEEPKKDSKPKEPEKMDMTDQFKEWNSDKFNSPPTEFRQGHVTPRDLDAKAVTTTEVGFTIQLPSKAPVPTPSVYKGKVYASGGFHSKEFYCFDAETGKLVWAKNLDDDGPTAAACEDGVIVFNTESCTLFALEADTGKQLWSLWLGDPLTSTPTIANGKVFTSYPAAGRGGQIPNQAPNAPPNGKKQPQANKGNPPCSHVLAAFDLKTGKILWQRWLDSDVMSAPVAVDKELYASSFSGVVYKLNQEDGSIISATKCRATSAPVVVGKNVYMTRRADDGKGKVEESIARQDGASNTIVAESEKKDAPHLDDKVQDQSKLKAAGGALDAGNGFAGGAPQTANAPAAWKNIGQSNVSTMQAFQGSRILNYDGRNYNCMGDECVCTDPTSGKELWKFKLDGDLKKEGGFLAAPPAEAGGELFLSTLNGEILRVDPKTGKVTQKYKVGSQLRFQPAVENGKIYVGTQDGKVVCIDTGDKKYTGWPCWGANAAHTGVPQGEKK